MKTEIEIYTKKVGTYFRGYIREWGGELVITCVSYAGGSKSPDILQMLDWSYDSETKIRRKIRAFCRQRKLVLKYIKQ